MPALGAAAVGGYLLAWVWRWPHDDVRAAGAAVAGTVLVLGGCFGVVLGWRASGSTRWVFAAGMSLLIGIGLMTLAVVSDDQQAACGDVRAECESLLPGF